MLKDSQQKIVLKKRVFGNVDVSDFCNLLVERSEWQRLALE